MNSIIFGHNRYWLSIIFTIYESSLSREFHKEHTNHGRFNNKDNAWQSGQEDSQHIILIMSLINKMSIIHLWRMRSWKPAWIARIFNPCPYCLVDGSRWMSWGTWSTCSSDCNGGQTSRMRTCDSLAETCSGQSTDTKPCNLISCDGSSPDLYLFWHKYFDINTMDLKRVTNYLNSWKWNIMSLIIK